VGCPGCSDGRPVSASWSLGGSAGVADLFQRRETAQVHRIMLTYYAENYRRLVKVNTEHDPDTVFHNQQSIPALPC
jgi:Berberine and berberine like